MVVIGLGRFGRAVAQELIHSGTEVLGIDADEQLVQELSSALTHVVRADSTSEAALRQLAVQEFDKAVVAIGSNIEASLLTASLLKQLGGATIWAKAISEAHGRILGQLGIAHVDYATVTTEPPQFLLGMPLSTTGVRRKQAIAVVGVKRPGASRGRGSRPGAVVRRGCDGEAGPARSSPS